MPVGTEVAHALLLVAAHHLHARELLVHRHGEVGVALVVAVLDVEPGVVLLDPGVLQLKGLDLRGHDRPLHRRRRGDHRAGARVEIRQVLEVARQALTQALRLSDVDHPAVLVAEFVHPGRVRDLSRLGAVAGGVGHVTHPTGAGRQRGRLPVRLWKTPRSRPRRRRGPRGTLRTSAARAPATIAPVLSARHPGCVVSGHRGRVAPGSPVRVGKGRSASGGLR